MTGTRESQAREVLSVMSFVEMTVPVLERAMRPFPVRVRILDALHLATFAFPSDHGADLSLASYDGTLRRRIARGEAFPDGALETPRRLATGSPHARVWTLRSLHRSSFGFMAAAFMILWPCRGRGGPESAPGPGGASRGAMDYTPSS